MRGQYVKSVQLSVRFLERRRLNTERTRYPVLEGFYSEMFGVVMYKPYHHISLQEYQTQH